MVEWIKDFWPCIALVSGYVILIERRLARLEGKLSLVCKVFCELVKLPNPDKKGGGKSWRYLFSKSINLHIAKKKGGDH